MIKLMPYASWVAVFCTALWIGDLTAPHIIGQQSIVKSSALSRKLLAGLLCSQMTFAMLAVPLLTWTGIADEKLNGDGAGSEGASCFTTPAIRSLQSLPKGLFVGSIDFGSYIVALTQHDALAAPYHRIDKAILINQALLAAEPTEAKRLIEDVHADYVVLCVAKTAVASRQAGKVGGLETRLRAGETVAFLTPLAIASPVADLRVWRVIR